MKSKDSNSKKSLSYQKKDGHDQVRPSFFWYDIDKDLGVCFHVTCMSYIFVIKNDLLLNFVVFLNVRKQAI